MSNMGVLTDKQGSFIGEKDRHALEAGDILAISALWVENSHGEVLLAQRSWEKKHSPGLWGPAASGTLEPGETFLSNITKEAGEEIGLTGIKPQEIYRQHHWHKDGTGRYAASYHATVDWPVEVFVLQKEEVEQVRWVSKPALLKELETAPEKFVTAGGLWQKLIAKDWGKL